jgi:hypothetical protein
MKARKPAKDVMTRRNIKIDTTSSVKNVIKLEGENMQNLHIK